jgi:hypothetical protein
MKIRLKVINGLLAGLLLISTVAQAGGVIKISDAKWVNVGASLRTELSMIEGAAPNGNDDSFDIDLNSFRMYMNAALQEDIKLDVQVERDGVGDVDILDGYVKFEFSKNLNIWAGRFIPPTDRSNLSGSYNLPTWDYPGVVSQYPNIKGGRDDGIMVWGAPGEGRYLYSIGLFDGVEGAPNAEDNPMIAARFAVNFWDPEGYLTRSTYYGSKDILSVGLAFVQQAESVGDPLNPGDYSAYNVDFMLEKNLANGGVGTIEAAYYDYYDNGGPAAAGEGTAYLLSFAYLLPGKVGPGKLQPSLRLQTFEPDTANLETTDRWDIGLTSVIDGHNTRVGLYYGNLDIGGDDTTIIKLGLQVKI